MADRQNDKRITNHKTDGNDRSWESCALNMKHIILKVNYTLVD